MTRKIVTTANEDLESKRRQNLAHALLIELLSYQFAFPVKWIDTQNVFYDQQFPVQRYVEVGPATVLANMVKKTASKTRPSSRNLRLTEPKFLSLAADQKHIYFQYDNDNAQGASAKSSPPNEPSLPPQATESATPQPSPPGPPAVVTPVSIPDAALTAIDIVTIIVSQKLRKPFDQLPVAKSIRDLSAGNSALQNEIVGDLGVEFGSTPNGVEDMSVTALGEAFCSNFQGQPGKVINGLVSKLMSSKMPAGFNQQALSNHLSQSWGLGPHRQTALVCYAVSIAPQSRISDIDAAKQFLNEAVKRYGKHVNLDLSDTSSRNENASQNGSQATLIDPQALSAMKNEYKSHLSEIYNVLEKIVHPEEQQSARSLLEQLEEQNKAADAKLKQWSSEFGEEMLAGTVSTFDTRKIRVYDSSWNWVKIDLALIMHQLMANPKSLIPKDRIRMILNRWTSSCDDIINYNVQSEPNLLTSTVVMNAFERRSISSPPVFVYTKPAEAPRTVVDDNGKSSYEEVPRRIDGCPTDFVKLVKRGHIDQLSGERRPFLTLHRRNNAAWMYNKQWTELFIRSLEAGMNSGLSFAGKTVLVTGAGPSSIASEIVRGLLEGGAEVLVTTSRSPELTAQFFNEIYKDHGSRGSKLVILPFNQGSKQDCEALIEHVYSNQEGYGGDLDYVIPFAAIGQTGELDGLESRSELAHRLMLINLLRLLGNIKKQKAARRFVTRPTNVILPLSPNHGIFGGDGLYPESKLGLETLFNRIHSEHWNEYLSIRGVIIGWTRGTGLMNSNNIMAEAAEAGNAITFSTSEMAFSIMALMSPYIAEIEEEEPLLADFGGNMSEIDDLKGLLSSARRSFRQQSSLTRALMEENQREEAILGSFKGIESEKPTAIRQRTMINVGFPKLKDYKTAIDGLQNLRGMVDLKKTVVVVGFSELGPLGSARTRWEMEHAGDFSPAGFLEMAWIMGLIEHFNGDLKGKSYVGWVDTKTKEPVHDDEIASKYGKYIKEHSGIRFIEPESLDGYDPNKKEFLHEIVVDKELPPFEASEATAEAMKLRHGNKVSITPIKGTSEYKVCIKKGAYFLLPKAVPVSRKVAGTLPKGWNPTKYGIPENIISQVDPLTLYTLCCVSEALLSAGITDPFEIYKHVHVSEIANCLGAGIGSLISMRGVYRDRYLEKPVQNDILQESFLNSIGAWTNMLLLASSGPIKSPNGTCATGVESLDSGCESILLDKAKFAFVGGTDDFQEETSYEFANMKATTNSDEEILQGRPPKEMSRPSTSSRHGFVESAGCGVQILTTAELALEMGLPIYGIVAHTQMSGDQIGRSVPAPGQGVLTAAREATGAHDSTILDMAHRRQKLGEASESINFWRLSQLRNISVQDAEARRQIEVAAELRLRESQSLWSTDIRKLNANISPIRAALSAWGLTIDDIQVASLHGTSTKANDINEADVINKQMTRLNRKKGNPLITISQKYLTGHPKGAAGSWMLNGGLQMLQTGLIPGNRNADNIDEKLQEFEYLTYPSQTIKTTGVKAFMLTSFGFGQKGGLVIAVAPQYLFSAISESRFEEYRRCVDTRKQAANSEFIKCLMTNSLFKAKSKAPWSKEDEPAVFLDPKARVAFHDAANEWVYQPPKASEAPICPPPSKPNKTSQKIKPLVNNTNHFLQSTINGLSESMHRRQAGVGVDIETIDTINVENEAFVKRNFTSSEIASASTSANPKSTFAGRWSAKEAVFKSLGVSSKGAGAAMKDIEIISVSGVPTVQLYGDALSAAKLRGIDDVRLSISHNDDTVIATAVAIKSQAQCYKICAETELVF